MPAFTIKKVIRETPLLPIAGIALLSVIMIAHFAIVPQVMRLTAYQKETARYEALFSSENGYRQIKQEITGKIERLKARLSPLPEQKNASTDLSGFLETLIAVAKKNEIRFVKIQPQDDSSATDYTFYPVLLNLNTTYHELGRFITSLEKLPNLFNVDRMAIEATADGRCDVKLLVTCLIPPEPKQ